MSSGGLTQAQGVRRSAILEFSVDLPLMLPHCVAPRPRLLGKPDQSDLVFANTVGSHLSPQNFLRRDFRPALERAGLPSITFHQLRHTAASLSLAQGVPVADVSAMLGHAGPHITLKIYAHIMPGSERQTATAMEKAING